MTFLLIVLVIRFLFMQLNKIGKEKDEFDISKYEDGPSEHNVWW